MGEGRVLYGQHALGHVLPVEIGLTPLVTPAGDRMVLAEAGHSNMGELFYEAGPKRGMGEISAFFTRAMEHGHLRQDAPFVAALQFGALVQCEIQLRWYYKDLPPLPPEEIQALANRAVATFLRAYAPQAAGSKPKAKSKKTA